MHVWEPVGRVDGQTVLCERCATVLANINGYDLDDEERFGVITCETEVDSVPWCERCGAPIADVTLTEWGIEECRESVASTLTSGKTVPGWLVKLLGEHGADTFYRAGVWSEDRWWPVSSVWYTTKQEAADACEAIIADGIPCEAYTEEPPVEPDAVMHGFADDDTIVTAWSVEDVLQVRPDLCAYQARKVLDAVLRAFDATQGITWETLELHASILYPQGGQE